MPGDGARFFEMNKFFTALIIISTLSGCATKQHTPMESQGKPTSQSRVETLISKMTLEEKVSLLGGTGFATRAIDRLGIPALEMTDGPVGVRAGHGTTAWPAAIAMAATFDPELVGKMAREFGEEARSQNKRLLLAPMVNITRTPWGGRNFESYGEDPLLTSEMARAFVTGVQSMGVGTSIKHFAVNNQEWGRDHIDVHVSERALREIYWPGFAAGVNAGSVSVMAAYNKANGAYCSENAHLLQDILKREWGFDGFVVSDWEGTHSTIAAALNGLDLEMPNPVFFGPELLSAVQTKKIPTAVIDDKVRRILSAIDRLGLLEDATSSKNSNDDRVTNFASHHPETALKIAQESIVLLKNDKTLLPLPLKKKISVEVLGPSATRARTGGGGSSFVHGSTAISAADGLRQRIQESGASIELHVHDNMSLPGDGVIKSEIVTGPFHGEFFNNPNLAGQPVHDQEFSTIDFDWEWGSPGKSVNANKFSARWTAAITPRKTGEHAFRIAFTQAARVYLDDSLIYDHWSADANQAQLIDGTVRRSLSAGKTYQLRIEYYKMEGLANLQLEVVEPDGATESVSTAKPSGMGSMVRQADYSLLFVGQSAKTESESFDRSSLRLPSGQEELILKTAKANPNTIVIVQAGSPIDMTAWASKVRSIVYAWYPGEQGGLAIADVLLGTVNPSGRLPISFPQTWGDSPAAQTYPGVAGVTTYTDDVFVGYRYFDLEPGHAAFRFGHGLSYTTFSSKIAKVTVLDADVSKPHVEVDASVKNTGTRAGAYVAQLYVGELNSTATRPVRELKGFKKVFLRPGQSADVQFKLDAEAFRHFDESSKAWVVSSGRYQISLLSEQARPVESSDITLFGNSHE